MKIRAVAALSSAVLLLILAGCSASQRPSPPASTPSSADSGSTGNKASMWPPPATSSADGKDDSAKSAGQGDFSGAGERSKPEKYPHIENGGDGKQPESPDRSPASDSGIAASSPPPPPPPPPPQTSAVVPTSAVGTAAPTDDDLIDAALAKLKKGNLAYSTPPKMRTGQSARVSASIGSNEVTLDALKSATPSEPGQGVETESTPVSTKMKMTLRSADFDITALSSEEQIVAGTTPTTWEWDITPKHAGQLSLHLAAVVELKDLSRDFTTVDKDIVVQVDPLDAARKFVKSNWQWILTTLGAGVAALWGFFRKRKKPGAPGWETP